MKVRTIKTRVFKENEDLISFIFNYLKTLPDKSILVITSKIVSLSEGRTLKIDLTASYDKIREKIIKDESDFALRTEHTWLSVKGDVIMTSAGIDESNANGKIILLPKDSFKTARTIHKKLRQKYKVKNLGVLIVDSRKLPTRRGIIGLTIGYAGLKSLKDARGQRDIFGRVLKFARSNVVDSVAAATVLCMGEGDERQPLALVTGVPAQFANSIDKKEFIVSLKDDLFLPLFKSILKK